MADRLRIVTKVNRHANLAKRLAGAASAGEDGGVHHVTQQLRKTLALCPEIEQVVV